MGNTNLKNERGNVIKPILNKVNYEYDWDSVSSINFIQRAEMFKRRNNEGWELVSVIQDSPNQHCFYWKKIVF